MVLLHNSISFFFGKHVGQCWFLVATDGFIIRGGYRYQLVEG